jgi:hypothetical protein
MDSATTQTSQHTFTTDYLLYIHVCAALWACGRVILLHKHHVLLFFKPSTFLFGANVAPHLLQFLSAEQAVTGMDSSVLTAHLQI